MSKFVECIDKYKKDMETTLGMKKVDEALLTAVAKGLGPSIYLKDASMVSCSDQTELDRVKKNFLIKKLGLADEPKLDAAVKDVCQQYNSKSKHRAVFYYLLAEKLNQKSALVK